MLYKLVLPTRTDVCLTNLVHIQFDLLQYATQSELLRQIPTDMAINQPKEFRVRLLKECIAYLDQDSKYCQGYGKQVAETFFSPSSPLTAKEGRIKHLRDFSYFYAHDTQTTQEQKEAWFTRIQCEIKLLFPLDGAQWYKLEPFYTIEKLTSSKEEKAVKGRNAAKDGKRAKDNISNTEEWLKAAGKFFLYFYENFLGAHDKQIPSDFLLTVPVRNFGRHELIELFHHENEELEICTMCDESKFYTRYHSLKTNETKTSSATLKSHAILDHYFPKDKYPHLCCHPYNLIPICYACNSPTKGTHNPIAKGQLLCAALPYRDINLSKQAYLKIDLACTTSEPDQHSAKLATITEMAPRPTSLPSVAHIEEAITILNEIYKLPARWQEERQTNSIVYTLFRRIKHFLNGSKSSMLVEDKDEEIYDKLKQLLYYLDHEDQRHDPYAFAMTWMLAAFLNEYNEYKQGHKSPVWQALVREITGNIGQSITKSEARNKYVEDLLQDFSIGKETQNGHIPVEQMIKVNNKRKTET